MYYTYIKRRLFSSVNLFPICVFLNLNFIETVFSVIKFADSTIVYIMRLTWLSVEFSLVNLKKKSTK